MNGFFDLLHSGHAPLEVFAIDVVVFLAAIIITYALIVCARVTFARAKTESTPRHIKTFDDETYDAEWMEWEKVEEADAAFEPTVWDAVKGRPLHEN